MAQYVWHVKNKHIQLLLTDAGGHDPEMPNVYSSVHNVFRASLANIDMVCWSLHIL